MLSCFFLLLLYSGCTKKSGEDEKRKWHINTYIQNIIKNGELKQIHMLSSPAKHEPFNTRLFVCSLVEAPSRCYCSRWQRIEIHFFFFCRGEKLNQRYIHRQRQNSHALLTSKLHNKFIFIPVVDVCCEFFSAFFFFMHYFFSLLIHLDHVRTAVHHLIPLLKI